MRHDDAELNFDGFLKELELHVKSSQLEGVASVELLTAGCPLLVVKEAIGSSAIRIETENDELTVCYGESHSHFGSDMFDEPISSVEASVLKFAMDIMSRSVLTYSAWRQGHCLGGGMYYGSEAEVIAQAASFFKRADCVKLKYWNREASIHAVAPSEG